MLSVETRCEMYLIGQGEVCCGSRTMAEAPATIVCAVIDKE